ncbi:MAG: WGR domain-containing protein, partial [Desulfamplus sp.]|nr:WGR domain-containing protein [Desulfamplus sp.]
KPFHKAVYKAMIYLENKTGNHKKFYAIELFPIQLGTVDFFVVRTFRGRIGTEGRMVLFGYADKNSACKKVEVLKHGKLKHGYAQKIQQTVQLSFEF